MLVSYNWIKEYVGDALPAPDRVAELLTNHAFEIEEVTKKGDDTVFDIKILPDRGSDCLSQRGIAREVASILGVTLEHDPLVTKNTLPASTELAVTIADTDACPRFTLSVMRGVTIGPSPEWLVTRLGALGQRSINNVVDATNYIMYVTGQPLHAYDASKFPVHNGKYDFTVRPAVAGETVSLLAEGGKDEDRVVTLKGGELLIVNTATKTAVGLAGVKGGRFAVVDENTTDIIIEAAHFDPVLTRKTARGLGIVIDASKRFENEPSRDLPSIAQQLMVDLLREIAGGEVIGYSDWYPNPKIQKTVLVTVGKTNALLGLSLDRETIAQLLKNIGATVVESPDGFLCTAPFERTDLTIEEDYIEEVGRLYGYHHVVAVTPEPVPLPDVNERHAVSLRIRTVLTELGFSEIITTSFCAKDAVGLESSLASDKSYLRSALTPNLAEALTKNAPFIDLLGIPDVRVFEIGTVFTLDENGHVTEHLALALGARLKTTGYSGKEDTIVTAALAALEDILPNASWVTKDGVAECNISELFLSLPTATEYEPVGAAPEVVYQPFSPYPSVSRDIALWVSEGTAVDDVSSILRTAALPLLVRLTHLDTFTKEGRTSLAFRLVFQSYEKTLDGSVVDAQMRAVYDAVAKVGWEVR